MGLLVAFSIFTVTLHKNIEVNLNLGQSFIDYINRIEKKCSEFLSKHTLNKIKERQEKIEKALQESPSSDTKQLFCELLNVNGNILKKVDEDLSGIRLIKEKILTSSKNIEKINEKINGILIITFRSLFMSFFVPFIVIILLLFNNSNGFLMNSLLFSSVVYLLGKVLCFAYFLFKKELLKLKVNKKLRDLKALIKNSKYLSAMFDLDDDDDIRKLREM